MVFTCEVCGSELRPCPSCGVLICACLAERSAYLEGQLPAPDSRLKWRKHWYGAK